QPLSAIYTLSLHDALPISCSMYENREASRTSEARDQPPGLCSDLTRPTRTARGLTLGELRAQSWSASAPCAPRSPCSALPVVWRSEEHTSELQSRGHLVCR